MIKIQKEILSEFISKYLLTDKIASVKWDIHNDNISTLFIDESQIVLGDVVYKGNFDIETEIGIIDSAKLLKLLSILDDEIELSITNSSNNTSALLNIFDKKTRIETGLRDLKLFDKIEYLSDLPNYDVEINVTDEFIKSFQKSASTLGIETFMVDTFDTDVYFRFGDTTTLSKVRLMFNADVKKDIPEESIKFNAKYLLKIFNANKEVTLDKIKIYIYGDGLFQVSINDEKFSANYYLMSYNG